MSEPAGNHEHGKKMRKRDRKKRADRTFDFSRYHERHIALRIAYLGAKYHGLAVQDTTDETIEGYLFAALKKACLIESRETAQYSRCGRTDKGVSAFGQVVSLNVRSNLSQGVGFLLKDTATEYQKQKENQAPTELNYVYTLNKLLPEDIRVLSWAPVPLSFDARFTCLSREYKYYFVLGDMDMERINDGAARFLGEHDFRNFCKMDVTTVSNFKRRILTCRAEVLPDQSGNREYHRCVLTVHGFAFLWHQIRCMVAVLFMIGKGEEEPSIIDRLLDVEKMPAKPVYGMASELPLVLNDCQYESLRWQRNDVSHKRIVEHFYNLWTQAALRESLIFGMLQGLESACVLKPNTPLKDVPEAEDYVPWKSVKHSVAGRPRKPHENLLDRYTADTYEEKKERKRKRQEL